MPDVPVEELDGDYDLLKGGVVDSLGGFRDAGLADFRVSRGEVGEMSHPLRRLALLESGCRLCELAARGLQLTARGLGGHGILGESLHLDLGLIQLIVGGRRRGACRERRGHE